MTIFERDINYWHPDMCMMPEETLVGYTCEVLNAFHQRFLQPGALAQYNGQEQEDMRACLDRYEACGKDILPILGSLMSQFEIESIEQWTSNVLLALELEAYNPNMDDGTTPPPEILARTPFDYL